MKKSIRKLPLWIALFAFTSLITRLVLVFFYNSNFGGVDQNVIYGIQRLLLEEALYQDTESGLYAIMQYTPLYYYLSSWVAQLLAINAYEVQSLYILTRSVALFFSLASVLMSILTIQLYFPQRHILWLLGLGTLIIPTSHYFLRGDSLHFFLFSSTLYFFIRYTYSPKSVFFIFSAIFAALAILTKQSGILLPFIIGVYLLFIEKKILKSFIFGVLTVAVAWLILHLLIGNNYLFFYKNAYLGLKNGFSIAFIVDMFSSQFYLDISPHYVLGGLMVYLFLWKSKEKQHQFNGLAIILSFIFAMLTGLKIGSSSNYFTEFIYAILISVPLLVKDNYLDFSFKNPKLKRLNAHRITLFALYVFYLSRGIGLFSSVFVERWMRSYPEDYYTHQKIYFYLKNEEKITDKTYIFCTFRGFTDNFFVKNQVLATKDVVSQIYLANPATFTYQHVIENQNKGLFKYVITEKENTDLLYKDIAIPFIKLDKNSFVLIKIIDKYAIYKYKTS